MANFMYDRGRQGFLAGEIDWDADAIKLVMIDEADDTPSASGDNALSDRAGASRVATSGAFASKTTTAGVADAADITLSTVTGDPSESIDIYKDSGTESTSYLIVNVNSATGLPVTPNGGDIIVQFDSGSNRIFRL